MERKPLRIVRLHEVLADLNNQAVFFISIEGATDKAIKELKATYGTITWKRAFEELSGYPYLTTGLKRLFKKKH